MPDGAVVIAGTEIIFRDVNDASVGFFFEDRDTGLGFAACVGKSHVALEARAFGREHAKRPASLQRQFSGDLVVIRSGYGECPTAFEMLRETVNSVSQVR